MSKGDIWWKFSKKDEDTFLEVCKKFKDFVLAGKVLNEKDRLRAGFSKEELQDLNTFYSKKSK